MYIKKLQGTFGCLENKTLTLSPGLNIITAPNESGKSTWCAFIRTMLFGISTREKARAGHLPDKERYRPWRGGAMYGRMELEKSGEDYVIERTSKNDVFSSVRVHNLTTGAELSDGEALVGVSASVYERTAFISQASIGIDGDRDTERLILSAASSGEEGVSADEVVSRLEKRRRAIRSPRGLGLLPELEAEISAADSEDIPPRLLPLRDELYALEADSAKADSALKATQLELREAEYTCERFSAFEGMSDSRAETAAKRDIERIRSLEKRKFPYAPFLFLVLSALFSVLTVTVDMRYSLPGIISAFVAAVFFVIALLRRRLAKRRLSRELKSRYGADTPDAITAALTAYTEAFSRLEKAEKTLSRISAYAKRKKSELETRTIEWNITLAAARAETEERREQLKAKRDELTLMLEAYELAEKTMREAQSVLQSRFSPELERRTAELFSRLTDGSFEVVRIHNSDFEMDVAEADGTAPKSILLLSRGTYDELYLALRLALCELILPQKDAPPIILDDALVNFDDVRMKRALDLLRELSKTRQIILFSCHSREEKYLSGAI